jgi:RNA polymerase sigma-70 factor, ECF subfamily
MAQISTVHAHPVEPAFVDYDEAAVTAALSDPAAFAALYRRYAVDVYRYCYRRLGTREAAEDATSQIFTRALAGLPGLRGRPFRPWLFTIARNVVIDLYRVERATASLDAIAEWEDPAPTPESAAITGEDRSAIRVLLSQLPERERQIVELRLAGLSGQEIAQALDCSHGAVRVAHHRALERLRALAEEYGLLVSDAHEEGSDASPR